MSTNLLYMHEMQQTECSAEISEVKEIEGKTILILNQTIFYPQGGGQPYDQGVIKSTTGDFEFNVTEVRFIDGDVYHIGNIVSGVPTPGMDVVCSVDIERRILNSRLHSAGHLVDLGLKELGIGWVPGKGYHFPEGAYVEYQGDITGMDIEKLKTDLENKLDEIIARNIATTMVFDESKLQNGKPMRTVFYGELGIACGGTHVANLNEIGKITIRKIKKEKDNVRIAYAV